MMGTNHLVASADRILNLLYLSGFQAFVGRPATPQTAVHRPEVIFPFSEGVIQPGFILVGVLVPDLAAELAEVGRALRASQKPHKLSYDRLEGQFFGGNRWKANPKIVAQVCARNAQ